MPFSHRSPKLRMTCESKISQFLLEKSYGMMIMLMISRLDLKGLRPSDIGRSIHDIVTRIGDDIFNPGHRKIFFHKS